MEQYKPLTIVNENNEVIGQSDLVTANEQGLLRRTIRVFLFNNKKELLLQQRSAHVFQPLLLDQSVGGHVDMGESYDETAVRETEEEMGLRDIVLRPVGAPILHGLSFAAMYVGVVPPNSPINFDNHEVAAVSWWSEDALIRALAEESSRFVPRFIETWLTYGQVILKQRDELMREVDLQL